MPVPLFEILVTWILPGKKQRAVLLEVLAATSSNTGLNYRKPRKRPVTQSQKYDHIRTTHRLELYEAVHGWIQFLINDVKRNQIQDS